MLINVNVLAFFLYDCFVCRGAQDVFWLLVSHCRLLRKASVRLRYTFDVLSSCPRPYCAFSEGAFGIILLSRWAVGIGISW